MENGETETMKHFITFEGIDGSGKSTVSARVADVLRSKGHQVILTVEPTESTLGKYVHDCIASQSDPYITSFTFIADRIQHCTQIQRWLDEGKIVLCDRYAESTYAYQAAQLETSLKNPLKWLEDLSKDRILIPDRTYLFVISPTESLARIQHRANLIPFERLAFLEKVHANYQTVCKGKRFLHLDAAQPVETLVQRCVDDILTS
jgi:dTMP kinase